MGEGGQHTTKLNLDTPPNLSPWQNFDWNEEHQHLLNTQWGQYCLQKLKLKKALQYLDAALDLNDQDQRVLNLRSNIKRQLVRPKEALVDARAAVKLNPRNVKANAEVCIALYEKNSFEDCKVELHDNSRSFPDHSGDIMRHRLDVVDENFKDNLGDSLLDFFYTNKDIIPKVFELHERLNKIDNRPLWKILKEQNKCDVQSIPDMEIELLSPLEIARRERCLQVFNQIYMNRSWVDIHLLKALRNNENLAMAESKTASQNFLKEFINGKHTDIKILIKMLHARSPIYNERHRMCPDRQRCKITQNANLNQIQYQTRRTMFVILKNIAKLRAEKKVLKLTKYIEEVMGDYVVIKTSRVMPWKFEFVNEVYNTLALAHADTYVIPLDLDSVPLTRQMHELLKLPFEHSTAPFPTFVFGDRSTFQEIDTLNSKYSPHKRLIARLEKRLIFAKYSIEKCYIFFEISRLYLVQGRSVECIAWANKGIEETKNCNSFLWKFHCTANICKAHAVLHKLERIQFVLNDLFAQAENLGDPKLCAFIERCRSVNNDELYLRKYSRKTSSTVSRKSRNSWVSLKANSKKD